MSDRQQNKGRYPVDIIRVGRRNTTLLFCQSNQEGSVGLYKRNVKLNVEGWVYYTCPENSKSSKLEVKRGDGDLIIPLQ